MEEIQKIRLYRRGALILLAVLLASLVLYGVLRPAPEERSYARLKELLMTGGRMGGGPAEGGRGGSRTRPDAGAQGANTALEEHRRFSEEERNEIRKLFDEMSPEMRQKLMREIFREQVRQARERLSTIPEEEKIAKVQEAVQQIRTRFSKINDEQRERIKADMNTAEGKQRMADAMKAYTEELTAKERELLDPILYEIYQNLNAL